MSIIELLRGPVTLSAAREKAFDVIHASRYPRQKHAFYEELEGQRNTIGAVVAHHLNIAPGECLVSPQEYWRHGSFNLCVPCSISAPDPSVPRFVMIRLPLPYRVGEEKHPGNADEKLRCEAAAYAWIQEFCPSVPIPQLYGFGLSTGQRFTNLHFLPWWSRWLQQGRRWVLALLGRPLPSRYSRHNAKHIPNLATGYLIIQTIGDGEMLSDTWKDSNGDVRLQNNLCRGLARTLLSLTSVPLPRIGAFRLDDDGYLRLDNRPLSMEIIMQENEGIPVDVPRDATLPNVDEFILQQVAALDSRMMHQPNAVEDCNDAWFQMASLAAARAAFPRMFQPELRSGPFAFTLTDLHPSNIIVDDDWNIVSIIDLEFSCSLPIEFQQPPFWLGGQLVDEVNREDFGPKHEQFLAVLEEQEQLTGRTGPQSLSLLMRQAWSSGSFWVTLALKDPIGFTTVFYDRIVPYHFSHTTEEVRTVDYKFLASLWRPTDNEFVERKLRDRERYLTELEALFGKDYAQTKNLTDSNGDT